MRNSGREAWVVQDEDGASAVEYALLLVGVFLAVFAAVGTLGLSVEQIFTNFNNLLN